MWKRFTRDKEIYHHAATHNERLNLLCFSVPLLLIQAANAIHPAFLAFDTRKKVTTILSIVSGVFIALQNHFNLHLIAEQWAHMATISQQLSIQAYQAMTKIELNKDNSLTAILEQREQLIEFADYCALMEKNNKTCPPTPQWIDMKIPETDEHKGGPFSTHGKEPVEPSEARLSKLVDTLNSKDRRKKAREQVNMHNGN